ncbi:unnamed protein product [Brassica oleracea var. botrytis]
MDYPGLPLTTLNYYVVCMFLRTFVFVLLFIFRKHISYITRLYGHISVYLPN